MESSYCVWEIFLPRHSDKTTVFHIKNHREFQKKIKDIAKIIMSVSHANYWEVDGDFLYSKDYFPMRLMIQTEEQLNEILEIAIDHYKLEKVYAQLISDRIIVKWKKEQ